MPALRKAESLISDAAEAERANSKRFERVVSEVENGVLKVYGTSSKGQTVGPLNGTFCVLYPWQPN